MFLAARCEDSSDSISQSDSDSVSMPHSIVHESSEPLPESNQSPKTSNHELTENMTKHNKEKTPLRHSEDQVFQEAPPPDSHSVGGAYQQADHCSPIDWSRDGRRRKLLLKSAGDIKQSCITQYYNLVDEIEKLSHGNKELCTLRNQDVPFSPVFKQIIANAKRNATVLPHAKRHLEVIKKFATVLFIYAGPLAYEFLQKNLHQALPSLRTVQRIVHTSYDALNEGKFRFDDLAAHIAQYNTTRAVSIGENATRIICRVEYDIRTNRCVGFVLPLQNGLPEMDAFLATSFDAIKDMFSKQTPAKYAYVYMAQPLDLNIPPFCLACFGTSNKFTAEHVLLRWKYIYEECKKINIKVVSFGGDGDSRIMRAMRVSTGLFSRQVNLEQKEALLSVKTISFPTTWTNWFWMHRPGNIAFVQDTVHIAVKLKCRLLKPSTLLAMGSYIAGVQHLRTVKNTFQKDVHGLRERDIDYKDKQNYDAVLHIIRALPCLEKLPDAAGTKKYIILMQCVCGRALPRWLGRELFSKIYYLE